jgi:Rod binding domain-containing protein
MSSSISLTTPVSVGADLAANSPKPKDPADAARQFEALLIHEMLKSARSEGSGAMIDGGEDDADSALSDMAEQQFAQLLAANGGIGLAKLVMDGLGRGSAASQSPDAHRQHAAGNRTSGNQSIAGSGHIGASRAAF